MVTVVDYGLKISEFELHPLIYLSQEYKFESEHMKSPIPSIYIQLYDYKYSYQIHLVIESHTTVVGWLGFMAYQPL